MQKQVLESDIERKVCELAATKLGIINIKLTSSGSTGYPDRIFWVPGGKPVMIEFKRPGGIVRPKQVYIHKLLRARGYQVEVCDNVEDAMSILETALKGNI